MIIAVGITIISMIAIDSAGHLGWLVSLSRLFLATKNLEKESRNFGSLMASTKDLGGSEGTDSGRGDKLGSWGGVCFGVDFRVTSAGGAAWNFPVTFPFRSSSGELVKGGDDGPGMGEGGSVGGTFSEGGMGASACSISPCLKRTSSTCSDSRNARIDCNNSVFINWSW